MILTAATRHFGDVMVGFGLPSQTWNAREQYRHEYSGQDKIGAGIGTAAALAIPATTLIRSFKGEGVLANKFGQGMRNSVLESMRAADPAQAEALAGHLLQPRSGMQRNIGRAFAAGVGTIAAFKLKGMAEDDGDWRAAGATAGMVGGAMLGFNVVGKMMRGKPIAPIAVPLIGMGAALGVGALGYMGGQLVKAGDGKPNKEHSAPYVTTGGDNALGGLADTARGFWNHFSEGGPITPGFSMQEWGQDRHIQKEASREERGGAIAGDGAAASVIAAGALTAGAGIVLPGLSNTLSKGLTNNIERISNQGVMAGAMFNGQTTAEATRAVKGGLLAVAAVPAAYAIANSGVVGGFNKWRETGDAGDMIAGGAVLGATALGSVALSKAVSKSGAFKSMAPGLAVPASALTGILLVSALSGARKPGQQMWEDFNAARKDGSVDLGRAAVNAAPAAVMGGVLGSKMGAKFGGKGAIIGTAVGALVGVGGGTMLSVGQKDTTKTIIGAAAGAALTAAVVNRGAITSVKGGGMRLAAMAAGGALAGAVLSGAIK